MMTVLRCPRAGAMGAAALLGVMVGLAVEAGEEATSWKQTGKLPGQLKVQRVVLLDGKAGVVAGTLPGNPPANADVLQSLQAERATVLRSTDGGASFVPVLDTQGSVVATDFLDAQRGWTVVARPRTDAEGSLYFLFSTADGGASWTEVAAIPAPSVKQVAQAGPEVGWVLGARTLLRTTDGGKTWKAVTAPGTRNPVKERICAAGADGLLIAGAGILTTRDGGEHWEKVGPGSGRVHVVKGDLVVADEGKSSIYFGRLKGGQVERVASLPNDIDADQIAADGSTVRIVATSFAKGGMNLEFFLLTSTDGGVGFRQETLPVTTTNAVGLSGARSGWLVTLDRRVLGTP